MYSLHMRPQLQLRLTQAMQQALHVLELPLQELANLVQQEIEHNPAVEEVSPPHKDIFSSKEGPLNLIDHVLPHKPSLFEYLMQQAALAFDSPEDLSIAETLIGNLDKRGFLSDYPPLSPKEQKVLFILQTFDPPGIAARSLQESLLLQLASKNQKNTLAYQIIEHHFEELLLNRLPDISKKLKLSLSALQKILEKEIAPLDLRPASKFHTFHPEYLIPDVLITQEDTTWNIEVSSALLPHFTISSTKELRPYISSATWLLSALRKRSTTLKNIARVLLDRHLSFFSGEETTLKPLTIQEVADELHLHPSTVARACMHKTLSTPLGLFPFRYFFSHSLQKTSETSKHALKHYLSKLVSEEEKTHPLSDEALAKKLRAQGIPCARRTIAKYRRLLSIPAAAQRRLWK